VQIGFFPKGPAKSAVAVQHQKLPDRAAVDATKQAWSERFDRLGEMLRGDHARKGAVAQGFSPASSQP